MAEREPVVRTVVIGLGNPLMGDDGLGLAALQALQETWAFDPPVEMVDGGTWGMNLLPIIEGAHRLLLIDAIDVGARSGKLVELAREEIPRVLSAKLSPHQIDLREVLALAELRGTLPPETVALGLQPGRVEMSTSLSPALATQLPTLVARVTDRLREWGYRARPLEVSHA